MKGFFKYWAPLYIYAGIIFFISGISKPLPEIDIPSLDKLLHVLEYGIFAILAGRAFKNSSKEKIFDNFKMLAALAAIAYGISDEFHQSFVAGRCFSVFDIMADSVGGILGAFIYGRHHPV